MSFTIADLKLALVIAAGILLAPIMAAVVGLLALMSLWMLGVLS